MNRLKVPLFGEMILRMPNDAAEAEMAYARFWSEGRNRPYLYADIILDNQTYLRHVEFDQYGIALRIKLNQKVSEHAKLFGAIVSDWCPIRSSVKGKIREWATEKQRIHFAQNADKEILIRGLPIPPLLLNLIATRRWRHPGDKVIKRAIPFLDGPVDFLSIDEMEFQSSGGIADLQELSARFHELRGSDAVIVPDLPWRDVSKSFFIAVNRIPGDDLGIALDFREGNPSDPRVIANDWGKAGCEWREVAPSFSEFLERIGIRSK